MEFITLVKKESVKKAEEILKKDNVTSRLGITIKDAKSAGLNKNGSVFLIDGEDEGVKRAKELIKDFVEIADENELKRAKQKIKEEQEKAAIGFGGIFNY